MKIYGRIFNDKLVKVFDTDKDKKRVVTFTTIKDYQKEAEVEIYADRKKIKTISFKDLPMIKARVIDLPITFELINNETLNISYKIKEKGTERHSLSIIDRKDRKKDPRGFIAILLLIFISLLLLLFFIGYTQKGIKPGSVKKDKKEKVQIEKEKEFEKKPIKKTESRYSEESLRDVIEQNSPLYFIKNRAILREGELKKLEYIAKYLEHYSKVEIIINGHTESVGHPENELILSEERSGYVKRYFTSMYPGKDFIFKTKGHGATKKVVEDVSDEQKYLNRRIEFKVISAK